MIGAETVPWWTAIVVPVICVFVGGVPWWNEKQQNNRHRREHEARVDGGIDRVVGVPANRDWPGQPATRGLGDQVDWIEEKVGRIERNLGRMNGKTIMQHIEDIEIWQSQHETGGHR